MSNITIKYTCKQCGTTKKPLDVPERAIDGDPVAWANDAIKRARQDHTDRRPACPADWFDVFIPISEDETTIGRKSE